MKDQNPFSFYDFLGYLIPGFLCLFIFFSIQQLQQGFGLSCILLNINSEISWLQIIILIIVSYFAGHILNFLSAVTVEKYSYWKYDYPSKYLMKLNHSEKYFIGEFHVRLWRFTIALILLPIIIGDYFLGQKLKFKDVYVKSLDAFLIKAIMTKGMLLFTKLQLASPERPMREYDYHRIISHYVLQKSNIAHGKTTNYLALYGYLRCMTLILSISFWIASVKLFFSLWNYTTFHDFIFSQINLLSFIIFSSCISYLTYMAFMKFYRRYSLENLMTLVSMEL